MPFLTCNVVLLGFHNAHTKKFYFKTFSDLRIYGEMILDGEEFDADYFRFHLLQSCHNTLRINSQRIQITHYHYKSSLRFHLKTLLCALTRCDAHSDSQNDCGNWDFQICQESTVLLQHNKPINNIHNAFKISLLLSDTISMKLPEFNLKIWTWAHGQTCGL